MANKSASKNKRDEKQLFCTCDVKPINSKSSLHGNPLTPNAVVKRLLPVFTGRFLSGSCKAISMYARSVDKTVIGEGGLAPSSRLGYVCRASSKRCSNVTSSVKRDIHSDVRKGDRNFTVQSAVHPENVQINP